MGFWILGVLILWLVLSGLPTGMRRLVSNWFKSLVACALHLVVVIPSWLIEWCSFTYSLIITGFNCGLTLLRVRLLCSLVVRRCPCCRHASM